MGEVELTAAIARLARDRALIGYQFEGELHDIGDQVGLVTANVAFALKRPELREELMAFLKRTIA